MEFFSQLFVKSGFMPHGHCYFWKPDILWTHLISDGLIALAYYSIPFALLIFVRRRQDMAFKWAFVAFAVFIIACGAGHILNIWVIWNPHYRLEGLVKAVTALASIFTAIALWPLIPQALKIPSPGELSDVNRRLEVLNQSLEQKVSERTHELEASNAELEKFAYVASHDLREPLRMITSFTQLLARRHQGQLDATSDEYIHYIVDGAERMRSLIDDLLEFSRAGSEEVSVEEFDSGDVLREVLANLTVQIDKSNALVEAPGSFPVVRTNRRLFGQVLQNLVSNALKYRGEDKPEVEITCMEEEHFFAFSVRDNGIGIDPKFHERIFELFQRLHTREKYPGTGIGLAITRKIVEKFGGSVQVESNIGNGSVFTVRFPKGA